MDSPSHDSKVVHQAYARKPQVELLLLSKYEQHRAKFTEAAKGMEPVARERGTA